MCFLRIKKTESYRQTDLSRNTPLARSDVSSAFMMTVPSSWMDTSPVANAVDSLTKLQSFVVRRCEVLDAIGKLTWHFHWNWNTTTVKRRRKQGEGGGIYNILGWICFTEKIPATGRQYKRINKKCMNINHIHISLTRKSLNRNNHPTATKEKQNH